MEIKKVLLTALLLSNQLIYAIGEINYDEIPVEIVAEAYVEEDDEALGYQKPLINKYNGEIALNNSANNQIVQNSIINGIQTYGASQTSASSISTNNKNHKKFYAGLGITAVHYTVKCDCPKKSIRNKSLNGLMTKVGYNINKYLGIEARGMKLNLKKENGKITHAGVFIKPMIPLTPTANAYTLIGVAKTSSQGDIKKINAKSLALGTGFEIGIGENLSTFVDYERLIMKSDAPKFDTITTGMSYGF